MSLSILDGATDVPVDARLDVSVDGGEGPARVWVDGGGTAGWVAATDDIPLSLQAGRTHTVLVEQCDTVVQTAAFTARREPVGDALDARTWAVDLYDLDAQWASPSTRPPDAVIAGMVGASSLFVFHTVLEPEPRLYMSFGESVAGTVLQYTCATTEHVPLDRSADPILQAGPRDLVMEEGDDLYAFRDLQVSGLASTDDPHLSGVRVRFGLDLRYVPGSTGTGACFGLASYGAECEPCADQPADTPDPGCYPFDITWPVAAEAPSLPFVLDPEPDPAC